MGKKIYAKSYSGARLLSASDFSHGDTYLQEIYSGPDFSNVPSETRDKAFRAVKEKLITQNPSLGRIERAKHSAQPLPNSAHTANDTISVRVSKEERKVRQMFVQEERRKKRSEFRDTNYPPPCNRVTNQKSPSQQCRIISRPNDHPKDQNVAHQSQTARTPLQAQDIITKIQLENDKHALHFSLTFAAVARVVLPNDE